MPPPGNVVNCDKYCVKSHFQNTSSNSPSFAPDSHCDSPLNPAGRLPFSRVPNLPTSGRNLVSAHAGAGTHSHAAAAATTTTTTTMTM